MEIPPAGFVGAMELIHILFSKRVALFDKRFG